LTHLTRRDFARLALSSAAFAAVPKAFAQAAPKRIRYAVVGLGEISVNHFMPACKMSAMSQVTALVSGHPEKAKKLAAEYGVPDSSIYSYETYDRMRDNGEIDAVYIGLPNSMHAEYTIRAAQAGKHVLCEKPMANTVKESEEMVAACAKANRKLMIAYRCQLEPVILKARDLIRTKAIGNVEAIEGAFGFNSPPGVWRLDRKLAGGGPLMDVGIYPLNTTRFLLGEEPSHISARSSVIDHDGRFNTVEENLAWTMEFSLGCCCQLRDHLRRPDAGPCPDIWLEGDAPAGTGLRLLGNPSRWSDRR